MPSIKQIGTICFAFYFIIFPNFTFADNITNASTCTNGVLGTYTGPVDIEANFDPNTINTTWYSNGTQLTGNNIPATCTYDNALTPPTPADRPGYTFGGWRLKRCEVPATLRAVNGRMFGNKCDNATVGSGWGNDGNSYYFGLTEDQTWAVEFENGDRLIGEASCNNTNGDSSYVNSTYVNSETWTSAANTMSRSDTGQYCWCRVTSYVASGAQQCSLVDTPWVIFGDNNSEWNCAYNCSSNCGNAVTMMSFARFAIFSASGLE